MAGEPAPTTIQGWVKRVVFRAADGAFAVVRLATNDRGLVTVIGPLAESSEGEQLKLEGEWERHAVHGEQFRAQRAVVELPRTRRGVERYLQSLGGIGPGLAERLVAAFGERAIEVLEKEPWRAAQVKGVGKRRAESAAAQAKERAREREAIVYLQGLGISLAYARRILKTWGDQAVERVRDNPYRLARDVPGVGFQLADQIARGLGIAVGSPRRIEAGVVHVLDGLSLEGHLFAPAGELIERAASVLGVPPADTALALGQLERSGAVVREGDAVYPPRLHEAEEAVAGRLAELLAAERRMTPPLVASELERLAPGQKQAIERVGQAGVVVLTGGPGTGKTTVVRALVASWERARRQVLLAAPTGRAAKRLHEATGRPAQTLHRLLEWGRAATGGRSAFGRDRQNPLAGDLVVVDEASMLDVVLARALVEAVPAGATLVLVGDVDQLPSVGPGRVLGDVIASGVVPVARLTQVFRQAGGSGIVDNAYRILTGELPVGASQRDGDFFVVPAEEPERARELVVRLCKERIPEAFGLDPVRDVQVLTPMHRGQAGTEELNRALQAALNPEGRPVDPSEGGRPFRVGDKVMQVRNDYERDVFNGDVGLVLAVETAGDEPRVTVDLDGRKVEYQGDALDALELAYAVSVHKSQGSEYPAVVIVLLPQHFVMLRRNLLYTAVTRGKRLVVVVGSERAIRRAVDEAHVAPRHTRLADRLRAAATRGKVER